MLRPQMNSAAQEALWPLHDFGLGVWPQSPPAALSLSLVSQDATNIWAICESSPFKINWYAIC